MLIELTSEMAAAKMERLYRLPYERFQHLAPAGTPKEIVELLQKEIAKAVAQPDVKEKLETLGFVPVASKPEEFGARIKSEIEKWGKVVRDAKLRVE